MWWWLHVQYKSPTLVHLVCWWAVKLLVFITLQSLVMETGSSQFTVLSQQPVSLSYPETHHTQHTHITHTTHTTHTTTTHTTHTHTHHTAHSQHTHNTYTDHTTHTTHSTLTSHTHHTPHMDHTHHTHNSLPQDFLTTSAHPNNIYTS